MAASAKKISWNNGGFSMIELLVSVAVFSLVFVLLISFVLVLKFSNIRSRAGREALENARRIVDIIAYETKGAKSIYTPTTSASQLSLETYRYLPSGENISYIDFFLCGTSVCLKKESTDPYVLNSDTVEITTLAFSRVDSASNPSITVSVTVRYKNPNGLSEDEGEATLQSTVSTRSY